MRSLLFFFVWGVSGPLWAAHGYALWGDLKCAAGFSHFDYVNPNAPKGGELRLVSNLRVSTFDKYNPFTIKATAPAYLADLMFDSLLTDSLDETGSGYGPLASDVEVAAEGQTLDVEVILAMAHHILVMKDGAVVESGPATRVLSAPTHGYPQTLLAAAQ